MSVFGIVIVILIIAVLVVGGWAASEEWGGPWRHAREKLADSATGRTRRGDWVTVKVWRCRDGVYEVEVKISLRGWFSSPEAARAAAVEAVACAGEEARGEFVQ